MEVVKEITIDGEKGICFECPGCEHAHRIPIAGPKAWKFNGDPIKPTVAPSILVYWEWGERREKKVCHLSLIHI